MKYCERPYTQAYIFPNGDVRACGWTYQCIGNILEEASMEKIWHSDAAERLRDSFRDGSFSCCNKVVCPFCNNDELEDIPEAEFEKRSSAPALPTEYNIAIDYICNHSCPSCRHEIFVPSEEYRKNLGVMIDRLIPYLNKARFLSTDGNGDCFASPYIMDMLERIQPEREDFTLSLETNGAFCDKEHLDHISHLFEKEVQITVTPNSFERQTFKYLSGGHDNLDRVTENLYLLKEMRKQDKIKQFDVSIVVQDTNYKELPAFARRCIEDFECDTVIVKPIFYWFALTPEEYWFKDILNPKHPYFDDYMEVLKDPILKDPKVYFWGSHEIHKPKEHPAYDYKRYFDVFADILKKDEPAKTLESSLTGKGKIAIYGTNDMAAMMYRLLKGTLAEPVGFIDRDAKEESFCGLSVTKFDTFRPEMADTILVSNFAYLTNVTRDLRFRKFQGEIIPFNEILS